MVKPFSSMEAEKEGGRIPIRTVIARVIRVNIIIGLRPEVDLFSHKDWITVIHFTQDHHLFPLDFAGHRDFPSRAVNERIQKLRHTYQKPPLRSGRIYGLLPSIKWFLQGFDQCGLILLVRGSNDLTSPNDIFTFVLLGGAFEDLLQVQRGIRLFP